LDGRLWPINCPSSTTALPQNRIKNRPTGVGRFFCRPGFARCYGSFGATCGSILGAYFGPDHLDPRWRKPFNDEIRTGLNFFYERSLSALARRMAELP